MAPRVWNQQLPKGVLTEQVEVTVSAGTAFKIGFYAAFGFLLASILPWILLFILVVNRH